MVSKELKAFRQALAEAGIDPKGLTKSMSIEILDGLAYSGKLAKIRVPGGSSATLPTWKEAQRLSMNQEVAEKKVDSTGEPQIPSRIRLLLKGNSYEVVLISDDAVAQAPAGKQITNIDGRLDRGRKLSEAHAGLLRARRAAAKKRLTYFESATQKQEAKKKPTYVKSVATQQKKIMSPPASKPRTGTKSKSDTKSK